MKKVEHVDEIGRKYEYLVPDHVSDNDIEQGILSGPMDVVDLLKLPEKYVVKLHNELYRRKIFTYNDARKRPNELQAAMQAAFRFDVAVLLDAFHNIEKEALNLEEV